MNPATISIAMATYNGGAFLPTQLSSLLSQTRLPTELVVCDDASSDDTCDIIERFAATSPFPVRLIRNPVRLGYIGNFLNALRECRSELVGFCDQDDVWHPDKLERCAACFDDADVMLVHHQADVIDEAGRNIGLLVHEKDWIGYGGSRPFAFALGFTELFRASILPATGWTDGTYLPTALLPFGHDQWIYFLAIASGKIVYIPQSMAGYRQHGANAFGAGRRREGLGWMLSELRKETEYWQKFSKVVLPAMAILTEYSGLVDQSRQPSVEARIILFQEFAQLAPLRDRLYADASLPRRIASLLELWRTGAYRKRLGVDQSILRDVVVALLGPSAALTVRKVFHRLSPA